MSWHCILLKLRGILSLQHLLLLFRVQLSDFRTSVVKYESRGGGAVG